MAQGHRNLSSMKNLSQQSHLFQQNKRKIHWGGGGDMSLFENENLAIFAGNSLKDSLINYSKVAKKYSLFRTMTWLQPQIVQL